MLQSGAKDNRFHAGRTDRRCFSRQDDYRGEKRCNVLLCYAAAWYNVCKSYAASYGYLPETPGDCRRSDVSCILFCQHLLDVFDKENIASTSTHSFLSSFLSYLACRSLLIDMQWRGGVLLCLSCAFVCFFCAYFLFSSFHTCQSVIHNGWGWGWGVYS